MLKRFFISIGAFGIYLGAFAFGGIFTYLLFRSAFLTGPAPSDDTVIPFLVEEGSTIKDIAKKLESEGLVKYWWSISTFARFGGKEIQDKIQNIQVGEYKFSKSYDPKEILTALIQGDVVEYPLRIGPGLRNEQISELIANTGLVDIGQVKEALRDRALMASLKLPRDSFEGFLAPGEYKLTKPTNAKEIVRTIVNQGRQTRDDALTDWLARAIDLGLTIHDAIILASIIEQESEDPEERKLVSSTLHNRLRIGMPLQSESVLRYGLKKYGRPLDEEDKAAVNPYNTFKETGLPQTAICNPSVNSLEAALYPADTDYLYYGSRPDGSLHFAATFKDHKEIVARFATQ